MLMFKKRPNTTQVGSERLPIDPDFRIMCDFNSALKHRDKDELANVITRFYPMGLGECSVEDALDAIEKFYADGTQSGGESGGSSEPVFDFEKDEGYFYAAFLVAYRIDLYEASLHWFNFCALFRGLPDDCKLKQIIGIRATNMNDLPKYEKKRYRKLKRIYALDKEEHYNTLEERDAAILKHVQELREKAKKGGNDQ